MGGGGHLDHRGGVKRDALETLGNPPWTDDRKVPGLGTQQWNAEKDRTLVPDYSAAGLRWGGRAPHHRML